MEEITSNITPDHAGVNLLPPMLLFAMVLAGLGLDLWVPLPLGFGLIGLVAGLVFAGDGGFLILWSASFLKKSGTNVPPNRPTKLIVSDGVYRFTRNPIYIGFLLAHASMALLFDTWWLAFMLPVFFLYIDRYVIPREEAYLTRKFGAEYTDYCQKVRRWF